MDLHVGNQNSPVRIGFVANTTDVQIHPGMRFTDMHALIVEFREVILFATGTFIQRILPPLSCCSELLRFKYAASSLPLHLN